MIAINAYGITKTYKRSKKNALDKLSLEIEKGQIFTLLGRNGAGKTTFLRIAATQLLPTSGSISVLGYYAPIAMILPTTVAASMFQGALGLGCSIDPIVSLAVLSVQAAILLLLVSFRMKWRESE